MSPLRTTIPTLPIAALTLLLIAAPAAAQNFEPTVGQAGKDVVWVPTPHELVEKMLDMADVGPGDFVMDLGSGDGRNIIAAAKRGARALGVEYNPDMVALSRRLAEEAGVADKATFVEDDMFEADISQATVMAIFLLPDNLERLLPKFLALKPGSRLVMNTFGIESWTADATEQIDGCSSWCTSLLYIVPAQVAGTWRLPEGELTLTQEFQFVKGTLVAGDTTSPVTGRLRGNEITLTADGAEYSGRVEGHRISGLVKSARANRAWSATRSQ